jgi:hypothetical protein
VGSNPAGSLVSVVCCRVEVSATGWSLFQRSPTESGVSKVCDRETSKRLGVLSPLGAVEPWEKNTKHPLSLFVRQANQVSSFCNESFIVTFNSANED